MSVRLWPDYDAVPDMERPVNTERGFGFIPARGKRQGSRSR